MKKWNAMGSKLFLGDPNRPQIERLENAVYSLNQDPMFGHYLEKVSDEFSFDYKLYGLETKLIERVVETYTKVGYGNLGVLLNGLKGTGKTVTAKILCNRLKQPVILVTMPECHLFLNSIPQDVTLFIDEYEKIFQDSSEMLTIMDGAMNSVHRRVFLMTTNTLNVESNMLQRPGRVRYLKKFGDLSPAVVAEIVDDTLEHKEFRDETVKFISSLENISVDIVKAVVNEVNMHQEAPSAFEDIFNVQRITGKYDLMIQVGNAYKTVAEDVSLYPSPKYNKHYPGYRFEVDGKTIGRITKVLNETTIEVTPVEKDDEDEDDDNVVVPWLTQPTVIKIYNAISYHSSYAFQDNFPTYNL